MHSSHSVSFTHILLAIFVTMAWALNFVYAKYALAHYPPFLMLALRMAIVALLLIPFYRIPPIPLKDIMLIVLSFSVLHLGCMFLGLKMGLDASLSIVVEQLSTPFTMLLGIFFFKEKMGWKSAIGIVTAIVGSFILMGAPSAISSPVGFIFMVFSGFFWAVYSILIKRSNHSNALALIAWIAFLSILPLGLISFLFEENHIDIIQTTSMDVLGALLYVAIGSSIVAHGLWSYLLVRNPVNQIVPFILLMPLFGMVFSILLLDETLSKEILLGGIIMTFGVGVITIRRPYTAEESRT